MKRIAIVAFATLAMAGGANAADIYNQGGGSLKDGPVEYAPRSGNHAGWSVKLFMGYAWGDRDVKQDYSDRFSANIEVDPTNEDIVKEATELNTELNAAGVDSTFDGTNLNVPFVALASAVSGNDDFGSFVGGGEIEYLFHGGGQFGFALNLGATVYGDAETTHPYSAGDLKIQGGTLFTPHGSPDEGQSSGLTSAGFATIDRQFDIDLTGKLYFFPTPDLAFHVKAGPSFAFASVKGQGAENGFPASVVNYDEDDMSIGVVVGAGITKWIRPNWSISLEGDWKKHSFEGRGSKNIHEAICTGERECGEGITGASADVDLGAGADVDDSVWTIKVGTSYHFD